DCIGVAELTLETIGEHCKNLRELLVCIDITGCRNVTDDGINSRRYDSNTGEINNQLSRSDYG
ncbi:hypothetical protein X777_14429, partial [Ooceraea biroi]